MDAELVNKLKKGSKVKLLIKCMGIWIASGKFGCTWRAEQMIVTTPESLDDFIHSARMMKMKNIRILWIQMMMKKKWFNQRNEV